MPKAIPGIKSLSSRLHEQLTGLAAQLVGPPDCMQRLIQELGLCTEKIGAIQAKLSNRKCSHERTALIPLSHVVVSLTDAVTVLNQLHTVLAVFNNDGPLFVEVGAEHARQLRNLKS